MIHIWHTSITSPAVICMWWLNAVTLLTFQLNNFINQRISMNIYIKLFFWILHINQLLKNPIIFLVLFKLMYLFIKFILIWFNLLLYYFFTWDKRWSIQNYSFCCFVWCLNIFSWVCCHWLFCIFVSFG